MQVDPWFAAAFVAASCLTTWLVARGIGRVKPDDDVVRPRGTWWQHANDRPVEYGRNSIDGKQEE